MDRPAACDTSGVNDPVESTWYRRECGHDRGFVGHIGRHEVEPCAHVLVRCGQVDAYHRAAVGQQSPGGGEPDSRCRPGYDERSRIGPITAHHASDPLRLFDCTAMAAIAADSLTARCTSIGAARLPERA